MSSENKSDKKYIKAAIIAVGVISIGGGLAPMLLDYFSAPKPTEASSIPALPPEPPEIVAPPPTVVRKPKPDVTPITAQADTPAAEPIVLPSLDDSDPFVLQAMENSHEQAIVHPEGIITNLVVFIDNFSRGDVVSNFSPIKKPTQPFVVRKFNGKLIIDNQSYQRYDPYAKIVQNLDVTRFMDFYKQITPLIDEAYQEIGYPAHSFNQTFENAIDQLLETPIIHYELEVESPSAMYQYVDKGLESLPDTQKLMLRMGPDNLSVVQEKLREIKNELQRL